MSKLRSHTSCKRTSSAYPSLPYTCLMRILLRSRRGLLLGRRKCPRSTRRPRLRQSPLTQCAHSPIQLPPRTTTIPSIITQDMRMTGRRDPSCLSLRRSGSIWRPQVALRLPEMVSGWDGLLVRASSTWTKSRCADLRFKQFFLELSVYLVLENMLRSGIGCARLPCRGCSGPSPE